MLTDDVSGLPELWDCQCLVGGHERAEQPVVEQGTRHAASPTTKLANPAHIPTRSMINLR
jgi:hypothetical protein